ncbi:hypothetical protein INT47_002781 [Mucor saturninus]|uniref:TEL2-interacting protein 1 n=1 Tax=Mucor saturninus TaxID=64648 RepID=A0A8H7V0B1_9FUNG|nr:hypothetical protein INT47_002781 [Mucor saturninus]
MTDIHELRKLQFAQLKPILDSLVPYSPKFTRANVKHVSEILQALLVKLKSIEDPIAILDMTNTNALIIRLNEVYKAMTTEEKHGYEIVIELYLKIMHFLLTHTTVKIWMPPTFIEEYLNLLLNLMKRPQGQLSEEVQYQAVKCVSAILPKKYKYDPTNYPLESYKFLTIASECITLFLEIIQSAPYIQLRLETLDVLSQILHANIERVDTLAVLLPGIVSKLCKTISQKAEKENHKVICSSLRVLGDLIQTVLCDSFNDTLVDLTSFEGILAQQTMTDVKEQVDTKLMNKAWYNKTKQSLLNVMNQILKIRLYPDWRTRLEFVRFADKLLSNCARTLDNCIQPLVEIMVLHMDDAYDEVSKDCKNRMQILIANPTFKDTIMPVLKDDLYEWMMKFPQYVISKDEGEKVNAMSLITGLILLLKDQSSSVLSTVLGRSSDGWMTALEVDKDSLHILEQKKADTFIELDSEGTKMTPIFPKIRFKHLVTDVTNTKITRVMNVIGKYCDLKSWIQHYMRYLSVDNQASNDPQAVYIIHSLLSGAFALDLDTETDIDQWIKNTDDTSEITDDKTQLTMITLNVLEDIMDILKNATLTNRITTALTKSAFDLDKESGNILTVCFGLQIVGLAASILEQEYLEDQLITVLYPLLAHLGSSNVFIHTYALITLDSIALICGLDSAQELAIQNIDYIINAISQHISVLSENARVPLVLKALIHVGGHDSLFYLDDSVLEIYDALERYSTNDWLCIQLCSVLFEIIQTMEKNLPKDTTTSISQDESRKELKRIVSPEIEAFIEKKQDMFGNEDKEHETMEEIGKYFLGRQEKGQHDEVTLEQAIKDQIPMDSPEEEEEPTEETKVPLNREESMAKEIMDKSSHFLTASSPQLRSQMLILLTSGVSILSKHPQELNQLIYLIWPSIINRFNDSQNYVVLHAAHLIERISEVSTDFLSRKFVDDLWPRFKVLLKKGITAASANTLTDYSVYSLYHRTQLCLLKTLTRIAVHVPMNQPVIKDILEESKYFHNGSLVHEQLVDECKALFKALARQQPDTVWFYEASLRKEILRPPSSLLDTFVIPDYI